MNHKALALGEKTGGVQKNSTPNLLRVFQVRQEALHRVSTSPEKITPSQLQNWLCQTFSLSRQVAIKIIRELVESEDLAYTNLHGRTFLEQSFAKPVQITPKILLCPPGRKPLSDFEGVVVNLTPGAAFGIGDHPTTRLCLRGLEHILTNQDRGGNCLDVGTGSGVLLIAALKLGMEKGLGLDLDPNALDEARRNVALNDLTARADIQNQALESLPGAYEVILANLRPPTLLGLCPQISRVCAKNGKLVLSGFRPGEDRMLVRAYGSAGFTVVWEETEKDWKGLVLKKAN